ncbi:MAG: MFS transporter permease [Fulvimarina manganoxydans]|uniref:MFS transporter n=1 Tax=Fulvimarina manganoxydans TaxID=937218 RepID=UPI0023533F7C|nr:MFS transporter [Fulvimarina manganoxydans]MCK5931765.1 MFS transporter permease [Fulvimarina manganoxydans]
MSVVDQIGDIFFDDEENRVCRDIPDEACREQPKNAGLHLISLTATKTADGLLDPKLVLPFLLQSVGAPSATIGFLVPVREALALLPQILVAHRVRAMARRKWVWSFGTAVEALAIVGMIAALLTLTDASAGWAVVALLAIFALGRSLASVSYKDVLGKTVSKTRRGAVSGAAGSVGAAIVLAYGIALAIGLLPVETTVLLFGLGVAAALFALAAFTFAGLVEEAGANDGARSGWKAMVEDGRKTFADREFRLFVASRALLTATALAPPYLLLSAGEGGERALGTLGSFVVASALAAILGSYVWGTLSDRSSRKVLILSALAGFLVLAIAALLASLPSTASWWPIAAPFAFFVLMLSYQGVRQGRKIHLTDMAAAEDRAIYTAVSNTAIGIVLVAMGAFGFVADYFGAAAVLGIFSLFCLAAGGIAARLTEVQE